MHCRWRIAILVVLACAPLPALAQAPEPAVEGPKAVEAPKAPEATKAPEPAKEPDATKAPEPAKVPGTPAEAWSSQGATTLTPGKYGLDVAFGFPQVRLMFHIPVGKGLEVNPFLTFTYWDDVTDPGVVLGDVLGAQIKLVLLDHGPARVAMLFEPGLRIRYYPGEPGFGFQLGFPEFIVSGQVGPKLTLFGGLKVPISMLFTPDFQVNIPVLAEIGAEYPVSPTVTVFGVLDAGPDFVISNRKLLAEYAHWYRPTGTGFQRVDNVAVYQKGSFYRVEFALSILLGASFKF